MLLFFSRFWALASQIERRSEKRSRLENWINFSKTKTITKVLTHKVFQKVFRSCRPTVSLLPSRRKNEFPTITFAEKPVKKCPGQLSNIGPCMDGHQVFVLVENYFAMCSSWRVFVYTPEAMHVHETDFLQLSSLKKVPISQNCSKNLYPSGEEKWNKKLLSNTHFLMTTGWKKRRASLLSVRF